MKTAFRLPDFLNLIGTAVARERSDEILTSTYFICRHRLRSVKKIKLGINISVVQRLHKVCSFTGHLPFFFF